MFVTETVNFAVGSALFVHAVFKAIVAYVQENKLPCDSQCNEDHPRRARGGRRVAERQPMPVSTLPRELPTAVDIKRALPKHVFESSVPASMYYVIKDFVQVFAVYALMSFLESVTDSLILRSVFIVLYWAAQGTLFFALFVDGHDCGHGSFSRYPLLNDIVGTITHGFLMVPFYQWKLSHQHHHKYTGNMDRDEVFYPVRRSQQTPGGRLLPGFALGFGWLIYLSVGYSPRRVKHFDPFDKMFLGHLVGCLFSLAAMGLMGMAMFHFYVLYGLASLTIYYLIPLFVLGSYIVVVTFLHHSEVGTPWYSDERWDFVRGQLSTVDRHYGFVHNVIHSIGTHQMHHMFSRIPHYHLEEATVAFRKTFPDLVRICDEPILPSFVRMFHKYEQQSIVEDDTKEHAYI